MKKTFWLPWLSGAVALIQACNNEPNPPSHDQPKAGAPTGPAVVGGFGGAEGGKPGGGGTGGAPDGGKGGASPEGGAGGAPHKSGAGGALPKSGAGGALPGGGAGGALPLAGFGGALTQGGAGGGKPKAGNGGEPNAGSGGGGAGGQGGAEPAAGDAFVSPTGVDADNDCQVEASPCKTIHHATTHVEAAHTIWLLDGEHGEGAAIPAGVAVKARNTGLATVKGRLTVSGSVVSGLVFDAGNGLNAGVTAVEGESTLNALRFRGNYSGNAAIQVRGSAVATLNAEGVDNYAAETVSSGNGNTTNPLVQIEDTASLTIHGGKFDGPGVGHGASLPASSSGAAFWVRHSAKLTLDGVFIRARTRGIAITHDGELKMLNNTILHAAEMTTAGYGVGVVNDNQEARVTMDTSGIYFFSYQGGGAGLGVLGVSSSPRAQVTMIGGVLRRNGFGAQVSASGKLTLVATEKTALTSNDQGGLRCEGDCDVDMNGCNIVENGQLAASASYPFFGGLWFGATNRTYHVKLREVGVVFNYNTTLNANTGNANNSGVTLGGDASSTFDLGSAADPGLNKFLHNMKASSTANLSVKVNAAVTVDAVGNTFDESVQGADAQGHYALGTSPCGASSCVVTSGAGVNYRVTSGALRLAE